MPTTRETILAALHSQLQVLDAEVLRNAVLPERVPSEGLLVLRDGEPVQEPTRLGSSGGRPK